MNTFANEIFPRTVLYVEFLSLQKYNFYLIKKNMKLKETKILLSEIWLCIIIDKIKYHIYLKNNDMRVFFSREIRNQKSHHKPLVNSNRRSLTSLNFYKNSLKHFFQDFNQNDNPYLQKISELRRKKKEKEKRPRNAVKEDEKNITLVDHYADREKVKGQTAFA